MKKQNFPYGSLPEHLVQITPHGQLSVWTNPEIKPPLSSFQVELVPPAENNIWQVVFFVRERGIGCVLGRSLRFSKGEESDPSTGDVIIRSFSPHHEVSIPKKTVQIQSKDHLTSILPLDADPALKVVFQCFDQGIRPFQLSCDFLRRIGVLPGEKS